MTSEEYFEKEVVLYEIYRDMFLTVNVYTHSLKL